MILQRTIKNVVSCRGVGLHTGENIEIVLQPAPVDHGIVFRRQREGKPVLIPALARYVGTTTLSTSLTNDDAVIYTVEHIMSAFYGLGLDNLLIDIDGDEIPVMDGSASSFVFLIESAGIAEQDKPRKFIRVLGDARIDDGDRWVKIEPHDGFRVAFHIDFDHPSIPPELQTVEFDFSHLGFLKEISRARTFGFKRDIEELLKRDLIRGGSLDNAILIDDEKVTNKYGLRYRDEIVRHKVLDAIGDSYLLGCPVIGKFTGHKSGHMLNTRLMKHLLESDSLWEYCEFTSDSDCPIKYPEPASSDGKSPADATPSAPA